MSSFEDSDKITAMAADYHISARGAEGLVLRDVWGPREKSMGNPRTPENPNGTQVAMILTPFVITYTLSVILRLAENSLMHNEIGDFIKQEVKPKPCQDDSSLGSKRVGHRSSSQSLDL